MTTVFFCDSIKSPESAWSHKDIKALHAEFISAKRTTGYEIFMSDAKVIPYYDFDGIVRTDIDKKQLNDVIAWFTNYVCSFYRTNGYEHCHAAVSTCIRKVANGTKLSFHMYIHSAGVYSSYDNFYHFYAHRHLDALHAAFPGWFVGGLEKTLFDMSMYTNKRRFRVLLASKDDCRDATPEKMCYWDQGLENIEAFAECFGNSNLTVHEPVMFKNKNIEEKTPVAVQPKPRHAAPVVAAAPVADIAPVARDEYPNVTFEQFQAAFNRLPPAYKSNRQDWMEAISCASGAMRQYKYGKRTMMNFLAEWSLCNEYPEMTEETEDQIDKILDARWEKVHKIGWLFNIVGGPKRAKAELTDIDAVDVVASDWSDMGRLFKDMTAEELVLFLAGCVRSMSGGDEDVIWIKTNGDWVQELASTKFSKLFVDQKAYKDKLMKPKDIMFALMSSNFYHTHNLFSKREFIPYAPTEPSPENCPQNKVWTLFNGWHCKLLTQPLPRRSKFITHIEQAFEDRRDGVYFLKWLAHTVQKPNSKSDAVIVYSASEGTGKSYLQCLASEIHKGYTYEVDTIDTQLLGTFCPEIEGKMLINCNEMHSSGKSITKIESMKDLITNMKRTVEEKHGKRRRQINCPAKFLFSTNNLDSVRTGCNNRRFRFLVMSTEKQGDTAYWAEMGALLEDYDELCLFFTELAYYDVQDFHPLIIRPDAEQSEIQIKTRVSNLSPVQRFYIDYLYKEEERTLGKDEPCTSNDLPIKFRIGKELFSQYLFYCGEKGNKALSSTQFWAEMKKLNEFTPNTVVEHRTKHDRGYNINGAMFAQVVKKLLCVQTELFDVEGIFD